MINMDKSLIDTFGNPPARPLDKVNEIVIHHTAGDGSWNGLKKWMLSESCERKEQFKKFIGLTHYYINKDGSVWQPFFLDTWLYHSCSGKHDKETIGIELVHSAGDFAESQYEALTGLIEHITKQCPITRIVSHDYNYKHYSGKAKGCPSAWFNWTELKSRLDEKGLNFTYETYGA